MGFLFHLVKGLGFEDFELGLLLVGAAIFGWLGLVIYREYFSESSWRCIYVSTTLIGNFFRSFISPSFILSYQCILCHA